MTLLQGSGRTSGEGSHDQTEARSCVVGEMKHLRMHLYVVRVDAEGEQAACRLREHSLQVQLRKNLK